MSRGGRRVGAGRPRTERTEVITVRISNEAKNYINKYLDKSKSQIIDELILKLKEYNEKGEIAK